MCPNRASFSINHGEDFLEETKNFKGMALAIHHGVEPDPRAALDSEGDQKGRLSDSVIHNMMEPQHAHRVCT